MTLVYDVTTVVLSLTVTKGSSSRLSAVYHINAQSLFLSWRCWLRKFDHISAAIRNELHWLPVRRRIVYKLCFLVQNCSVGEAPQYLQELCVPLSGRAGRQNLRSSDRGDLLVPRFRTSRYGRRSFSVAAPSLWNSLPVDIRQLSGNPEQFKKKLKTVLFLQFRCQAQVGAVPVRHIPCRPQGALAEPSRGPTFPRIWAQLHDKQKPQHLIISLRGAIQVSVTTTTTTWSFLLLYVTDLEFLISYQSSNIYNRLPFQVTGDSVSKIFHSTLENSFANPCTNCQTSHDTVR